MQDPILDEISRVREQLIKEHGGLHGLFKYLRKLDRARSKRAKQKKGTRMRRKTVRK
jgi:hypothetical protein